MLRLSDELLNKLVQEYLLQETPLLDNREHKGQSMAAIKRSCAELFSTLTGKPQQKLVLALLYVAENHVEAAGALLSKREDHNTHYVHGLIQRRLGDYALASYYFRVVNQHPVLLQMAAAFRSCDEIRPVTQGFPGILKNDTFNPAAMTGVVQQVCMGGHVGIEMLIRRAQALEMETLLRFVCTENATDR